MFGHAAAMKFAAAVAKWTIQRVAPKTEMTGDRSRSFQN
jgi:hypothetical protein